MLAEAVANVVDTWPGAIVTVTAAVSGWITLYLKQRGASNKVDKVGNQVTKVQDQLGQVQDQVTNGHRTNLRDDVTSLSDQISDAVRMLGIVKDSVEQLHDTEVKKIHEDIARVSLALVGISTGLDDERKARAELEKLVRRHFPDSTN